MDHYELDALIDRYLDGKCSPEEKEHIDRWLDRQNSTNPWSWPSPVEEESTKRHIKDRLYRSIFRERQRSLKTGLYFRRMAACILALLTIGIIFYQIPVFRQYISGTNYITVNTLPGQRKQVMLPDSSVVMLNVGSTIRYLKSFSDTVRAVELVNGEVWFEVTKDHNRPFVVHSNAIETKVLGTTFNIRSYDFLPEISVTVASGKVQVLDELNSPTRIANIISPNQQVKINKKSRKQQTLAIDPEWITAWRQDKLYFDKEPLDLVVHMLENKFGTRINIDKINANEMLLTANFEASDSLESILQAISATFGLSYSKTAKDIVFNN